METTERIVEAYVRYVKGWATIANVRCDGQSEIDLVAIDPASLSRYHIETSISISQGFRKLTGKPFDAEKAKQRVHQAPQRRTVGFFVERKFDAPTVVERLEKMGFRRGEYTRVIVTWSWDDAAAEQAEAAGIELWDFREIIQEIAAAIRDSHEYFTDDTLRTLNLFIHASDGAQRRPPRLRAKRVANKTDVRAGVAEFWVYENWTHKKAVVHLGSCSFCRNGHGVHLGSSNANGRWLGPLATAGAAWARAKRTGRRDIRRCGACSPAISD